MSVSGVKPQRFVNLCNDVEVLQLNHSCYDVLCDWSIVGEGGLNDCESK